MDAPWGERVTGTRAFLDRSEAEAEAKRMNALNGAKGCEYVVVTSRLWRRDGRGGEP